MDDLVECSICGTMNRTHVELCTECNSDLKYDYSEEELDIDCCSNCSFHNPASEIECPILAKKWDRDRIEIDTPKTMSCESYRRINASNVTE